MTDERDIGMKRWPSGPPTGDLRRRLMAAIEHSAAPFVDAIDGPLPTPAPGQVWRARWEGIATAVLLLTEPSEGRVLVAVITFDTDLAEQSAHLLSAEDTTLQTEAVAWTQDARDIPIAVLDRFMGEVRAEGHQVDLMLRATINMHRRMASRHDHPGAFRASLIDDLATFTAATWLPTEPVGDVSAKLAELRPSEIARVLNIPTADALRIRRGDRAIEADEAPALAELVGATPEDLTSAARNLPDALVSLFNQPEYRAKVVQLARSRGHDETLVRRQVAYELAASAARATGARTLADSELDEWRQRVRQYFDIQLSNSEQS